MQVRYQAALRPDTSRHYSSGFWNYQKFAQKFQPRSSASVAWMSLRNDRSNSR